MSSSETHKMSDLKLVQLIQNLLLNTFQFFILQDLIDIIVVNFIVDVTLPTTAATWSAVPLISPLVQHAVVQLGLQDVDV